MLLDIFHDVVRRHLYDKPPRILIEALKTDAAEPCVVPMLTLAPVFGLNIGEGITEIKFIHIHDRRI